MSNTNLPYYSFLPWLRKGIAANINTVDQLGLANIKQRANVTLTVDLKAREAGKDIKKSINRDIQLIGPGDIVGINKNAVVRTEPRNWVTDFEPNYLPFIEFYDEDFPWRYTPARENLQHRLRPWVFLLVLTESEFTRRGKIKGSLASIRINVPLDKVFPPPKQTWAWAHVYVNRDITGEDSKSDKDAVKELESILNKNPDLAASRLICPRKLKPNTGYYAFLIPAFENGRLAGLGQKTNQDSLKPSWEYSSSISNKYYPVYYEWYFRTSAKGDFEYLVTLLEPRAADKRVGIRPMDVREPGFGVEWEEKETFPSLGLEGALRSPAAQLTPWPSPPPAQTPKFLSQLQEKVNLQEDLQEKGGDAKKPTITPPLYGKWHAVVKRLEIKKDNWVNGLNKDPRTRTAGGFGTLVVQKNQEEYMQSAWEQVGDIIAANQRLKQGQLAVEASFAGYNKHFKSLCVEQVLAITAPVHNKVLVNSQSIKLRIKTSKTPNAAFSAKFRSITSPRRPIMKRMDPGYKGKPGELLRLINEGILTAAPPKKNPEKQTYLNDLGLSLYPSEELASLLREENLTPEAVDHIPGQPNFLISDTEKEPPTPDPEQEPDTEERFRQALKDLFEMWQPPGEEPEKPLLDASNVHQHIMAAIDPRTSIPKRILSFIQLPELPFIRELDPLHPVMAHPDFPQPMYKPLSDISTELLVPNLDLIPQNTISLLETNQKFIESYMVGLNHEMGRELLWREYPTDQRGSYFRQFWDVSNYVNRDQSISEKELTEKLRDIKPIHTWGKSSKLGQHNNRETGGDKTQLVLVIRGDLLKRYPNTVIYAQKAKWGKDKQGKDLRVLEEKDAKINKKFPLYGAQVEPDISFIGFDLTADVARGDKKDKSKPGWFFVIQERPGEPRFGLDAADNAAITNAKSSDDLSWGHIVKNTEELKNLNCINLDNKVDSQRNIRAEPDVCKKWNTHSADLATLLYQVPMMVAVHASDMLLEKDEG